MINNINKNFDNSVKNNNNIISIFSKNIKTNYLAYILVISSLFGYYAAFTLLLNRIEYYKNPNFIPPCSINPWLDCGTVMKSKWAYLFGFPNTIIGLSTYPMAFLTGLTLFFERNNKYFILFCLLISGIGVITNIALLYISAFLISALCPWCILAGVATSNIFFAVLKYSTERGYITNKTIASITKQNNHIFTIIIYYLLMFFLVFSSVQLRELGVETYKFKDPIFWLK